MKKLLLIVGLLISVSSFAQEQDCKFTTEAYLTSREVFRGVGLGTSPSVGAKVEYKVCKGLTLTSKGMSTLNLGEGYNAYLENSATVKHKNLSLTVGDLYYFYGDGANNYFKYGSEETSHLFNASVKYNEKKWYALVQTTIYKNTNDKNNGVYFEAGYKITECLYINTGYVTDASTTNFRTDAGFTHVGIGTSKTLKISEGFKPKLTTLLSINPTYKNVVDVVGVSKNPIQMALGLTF